jgi:hypothetical protein
MSFKFQVPSFEFRGYQSMRDGPMRSVPPRGSGWVLKNRIRLQRSTKVSASPQPTRYRVVVLSSFRSLKLETSLLCNFAYGSL